MAYSEHNMFLSFCKAALVRSLIISHLLLIISTNAKPVESPEQATERQKLYMRILGVDSKNVGTSSNRLISNNDIPPATPFPSIILAPYLNAQKPVEKPVDQSENAFDLPLVNNNNGQQFRSVQAPKDPFTGSSDDRKQVKTRQAGQRWPWPTPPPIPSSANARARNPSRIAERDEPLPTENDVAAPAPAPRPRPHSRPIQMVAAPAVPSVPTQAVIAEQSYQESIFDPENKPGRCPALFGNVKMCRDSCTDDADCDGEQKCCWDGCEKACVAPLK